MTSRTHDLAAFTALNIVFISFPVSDITLANMLGAIGACFLGGLTPDLDEPTSEFWQKFPIGSFLGNLFHPFIGRHRLISHSFFGLIIISILLKYILGLASGTIILNMNIILAAFIIGYLSHLIMDSITIEGIPLFFPIRFNIGFPPLKILRIKTGSIIEKFIIFPLLTITNIYLFYKFYPFYLNLLKKIIQQN